MARKLVVEIIGDSRSLERALGRSEKAAGGFSKSIGKMAGLATAALGAGGLADAAHAAFEEFQNAQQVAAQTTAVIKSTGQAANVTAGHVDDLANAMLRKTGIDDEATKTAENMLLTFTKVRNEAGKGNRIFDQATQSVADMATAMNRGATPSQEQMQQAAIRLGKALQDPIKGVGSLRRVGVAFTEEQTAQIKALVKSGQTMEAQKMILRELQTEFGGAANAAGKTLGGQIEKLKNTLLNLGASIVAVLAPSIQKLVAQLTAWLSKSQNQKTITDAVKAAAQALATAVKVLTGAFHALNTITGSTKRSLELLLGVLVAYKGLRLASSLANIASGIGGIRTAAGGGVAGKAGLVGAAAVGGYAIGSQIAKHTGVDEWIGKQAFNLFGGGGGGVTLNRALSQRYLHDPAYRRRLGDLHVHLTIDGKEVAAAVVPHAENTLAGRQKARPHTRRGN